jgi:uncharacterized protein YdhG (YjbR/CyaY superfamily)
MKTSAPASIEGYIASFPLEIQTILRKIRAVARKEAPEACEKICYGIPTFHLHENLVHYAAFKEHVSFFPTSSGVEHFKKELKDYDCSRGTIRFPLGSKIPYPLLSEIVRFRVKEATKRERAKSPTM